MITSLRSSASCRSRSRFSLAKRSEARPQRVVQQDPLEAISLLGLTNLDPQMAAAILAGSTLDAPKLADLTPAMHRELSIPPPVTEPIGSVEDTVLRGPIGPIRIRVYQPCEPRASGVIVFIHGGGWVLGSVEEYEDFTRVLCNRSGRTVASVEYRLAPEHKFPTGLEDVYAAVEWLGSEEFAGAGPHRFLAVAGDSAGGNLATVACYLARERLGPHIDAQVLIYPVTSFDEDTESIRSVPAGPWLEVEEMRWFGGHYLPSEADRYNPLAAPLLIANLVGVPPALVITAEYDPLRDGGRAYANRLQVAGVPVEALDYPGLVHGFIGLHRQLAAARDALDRIVAFLDQIQGEYSGATAKEG